MSLIIEFALSTNPRLLMSIVIPVSYSTYRSHCSVNSKDKIEESWSALSIGNNLCDFQLQYILIFVVLCTFLDQRQCLFLCFSLLFAFLLTFLLTLLFTFLFTLLFALLFSFLLALLFTLLLSFKLEMLS